jgi:GON domain
MQIWKGMAVALSRRKIGTILLTAVTLGMLLLPGAGYSQVGVLPATCQDIKTRFPAAPDSQYIILAAGNKLMSVYCHDMANNPREYITLAQTGEASNFSQYTAGGASPGTNVRTSFTRVRLDPTLFIVDIGDLTFANSVGSLTHSGNEPVKSMPYGAAMSCDPTNDGRANIDLRGTPFAVADTFQAAGFPDPNGAATVAPGEQVVELKARGFCGWITSAPFIFNPFNPTPGDFHLDLKCTGIVGSLGVCL